MRTLELINQEYTTLCAKMGEKTHILQVTLPDEIQKLHSDISKLREEAGAIVLEHKDENGNKKHIEVKHEENFTLAKPKRGRPAKNRAQ